MDRTEQRRQELLDRMADFILAEGLSAASLRPLAAAAGTSDRMLMHYFRDKNELLHATLMVITNRLVAVLDETRTSTSPIGRLIPSVTATLSTPPIVPFVRVWLDLVAGAAVHPGHRQVAGRIASLFEQWVRNALEVDVEEDRAPLAAVALAIIEGQLIFTAIGRPGMMRRSLAGVGMLTSSPTRGRKPR
jgi:AcrR family transcriptional regulator